jgi:hypothetical protein
MATAGQRISSFISYFTGRYAPAFITFLILSGGFFLYYQVVVSKNENDLRQRNFRGLQRMADNISTKLENYHAKNSVNFFHNLERYPDSRIYSEIMEEYGLERVNDIPLTKETFDSSLVGFSDDWLFLFRDTTKRSQVAATRVKKFVSPLLRRDLFPRYLFGYRDIILFDELNITHKRFSSLLSDNLARDLVKKNMIETGQIWNLEIAGKPYKLFLLHFTVMDRYPFTLGGYIPAEEYQSEKNHIPIYAILWMIIGLILVVLMFPMLKLFLMHRSEQLLLRNAISSLASIHVLGAIAILAALNIYVYFSMSIPSMNQHLKSLESSIEHTLRTEINDALGDIDSARKKIQNGFPFQDEDSLLTRIQINPTTHQVSAFTTQAGLHYLFLENLTFTDSSGQNIRRWTSKSFLPTLINVRDRDYFQAVRNGNLWHWDNGDSFYLTSISSWNSNENLAIISTSFSSPGSLKTRIATLSGPFRSLFDALLPEGYGFCIIDQYGDVKFHQDQKRNLNENLLEECDDNSTLKSILYSHSKAFFGSRYSGEDQRFFIKPLSGTPYYMVTFCNMQQLWAEDLDVISVSSILSLMNLAIILIVILTVQVSGYKDSFLRNQSIFFTWLRPNYKLKPAYTKVTALYLVSMILQLLFFMLHHGSDYLCLVGIAFSYSFILISFAYYQFAIASNNIPAEKIQKIKSLYWLSGLFLLVNILFVINLQGEWYWFVVAEILLIAVAVFISRTKKTKLNLKTLTAHSIQGTQKNRLSLLANRNFRWWYILSFFSFITATSVMPVIIFYFISFKHERLLSLKRSQLEFAGKLFQKPYNSTKKLGDSLFISYELPYHFTNIAEKVTRPTSRYTSSDTLVNQFDYLFNKIKPTFSLYSKEFDFLNNSPDSSIRYSWQIPGDSSLVLHYSSPLNRSYFDTSRGLVMQTHIESGIEKTTNAIHQDYLSFIVLIASLILLLTGFFYLMRRLLNKVFFDGYDPSSNRQESDIPLINTLPANEHVFITGPPNSSKYQRLRANLNSSLLLMEIDIVTLLKQDVQEIVEQFSVEKEEWTEKHQLMEKPIVLVRHFELYASNSEITEKKLLLLEFLLQQKVHIIVLSARSFEAMPLNQLPETSEENKYVEERWSNVMNNFYMLYHCWEKPAIDVLDKEKKELREKLLDYIESKLQRFKKLSHHQSKIRLNFRYLVDQLMKKIDEECAHSDFLWGLRKPIYKFLEEHKNYYLKFEITNESTDTVLIRIADEFSVLFEQICLKIQSLSANYYLSLWQSLSKDEQRTLYDISLDEIVNPSNRDIANRLAGWGLVISEADVACYNIMNNSFRNFIFNQLSKSEIKFIKVEAAEKGSWSTFQLPVLLTVVGIGVFLFVTQREAFTNLISYLGAAAAGIAGLLKILGMIPNSKT